MKQLHSIPPYPVPLQPLHRAPRNHIESSLKGFAYEKDAGEAHRKLASGNWVAIDCLEENGAVTFILGWV